MRIAVILAAGLALGGCGESDGVDPQPDAQPAPESSSGPADLECGHPTVTDLGGPTLRAPAYVRVTAGRVRVEVRDLSTTMLGGEVTETAVYLGDGDQPVGPDPSFPERPADPRHRVVSGPEAPAVLELESGRYWVVAARSARVALATCPDVEVSDVAPAAADPHEVFGSPDGQ